MAKQIDATLFDEAFGESAEVATETKQEPEPVVQSSTAPVAKEVMTFMDTLVFKGPIIFDIETGPLPDSELSDMFTFDESKVPDHYLIGAEFDPASVRYGNLKDETKRAEKLQAALEKFKEDKAAAIARAATAEQDAYNEFVSRAALSATTGRVLTIAYMDVPTGRKVLDHADHNEAGLLTFFWEFVQVLLQKRISLIGFNSNTFDIPFLCRRAMYHGIPIPMIRRGRYLHDIFIDLRDAWGCGEWQPRGNLDDLARFFGGPAKNGSGADFHKLWHGTPEERQRAAEYALNDLDMTLAVAKGVQVI